MVSRHSLGIAGLVLFLFACDDGSRTGAGTGNEGTRFEVGDTIDGGRVTQVAGDDCQVLTVSYEPEWECSAEQLALVHGAANTYNPGPPGYPQPGTAPATSEPESVALTVTDCEGLAALRRPELKARQQQALDSQQRSILEQKCLGRTGITYVEKGKVVAFCTTSQPQPTYPGVGYGAPGNAGFGGTSSSVATAPGPVDTDLEQSDGASEYSTTNTQVAGVDEADFVKNDAEHVYILSKAGLHVIDAWPAAETKELRRVPIDGVPRRLFLQGDKLVVYSALGVNPDAGSVPSNQGCTYGYDCRFSAEPGQTLATIFDVSDPSDPKRLRSFAFSGNFVASRRVGRYVYTVVQDSERVVPLAMDLTLDAASPDALAEQYRAKTEAMNRSVDSTPAAAFLPWIHRTDASGAEQPIEACDNALAARAAGGQSFVSLVSFDLDTLDSPRRTLIAGKPGYVYASATALYLATDGIDGGDFIYAHQDSERDRSTIHKFALDGLDTSYRGSAGIPGHVLNQFSMDELDGVLRVATSSGWVPDPSVSSNLLTLSEASGQLSTLGSIGGIAPSEDIRSVRFDGTRAFVVTFKKTDPLFVFDLTDPNAPSQLGELKIPGFSTYMHPLDRNHLLAIGFDADDHGSFAYFNGIQLQIFDVTQLSNPTLLHKTTIGTRGSASEALTNHLAFNYFPSKGLLALPMTVCEGGGDGMFGDQLTFSGLMVFDVSLEAGIKEHGRMPFVDTRQVTSPYGTGFSCSTWWAQSTSDVKRSIFMDDYAIGISDTLYQVSPLSDLGAAVGKIPLGN